MAFATIMFGQRIGDEMNEGREIRWHEYFRGIPILGYPFKFVDGLYAAAGLTGLEHGRLRDLDPPSSYKDNLDLLLEVKKLGIIDQTKFDRTVENRIVKGRNFNYACLKFVKEHCPNLFPRPKTPGGSKPVESPDYIKRLRYLRWDRDYYVYSMDAGLMKEVKGVVKRHLFFQEIQRLCATERDGDDVTPIPWALKIARDERFLNQHEYKRRLDLLLKRFDARLKDEIDEEEPEIRGEGGWGPFFASVFIGPRVGYSLNEGRGIRGIEYVRVIPLFGLIAELSDGFAAYRGRTANLAAWDAGEDPLAVRWEWVDMLDQCRAAGLIGQGQYAWRLGLMARGGYTNLKLLDKALDEKAIGKEQYADALKRILKERDWPLNPLNHGVLEAALAPDVRAIAEQEARDQLKVFLEDDVPSFYLLRLARKHDVLTADEYREKVRELFERVYEE